MQKAPSARTVITPHHFSKPCQCQDWRRRTGFPHTARDDLVGKILDTPLQRLCHRETCFPEIPTLPGNTASVKCKACDLALGCLSRTADGLLQPCSATRRVRPERRRFPLSRSLRSREPGYDQASASEQSLPQLPRRESVRVV